MVALVDVNVLLALSWRTNLRHQAAHRWLSARKEFGWATCPQVQSAFLRLSLQPAVVEVNVSFLDAITALAKTTADPSHHLWAQDYASCELDAEIIRGVRGHNQVADAMLLDLAIRNGGVLATFDQRLRGLLPAVSSRHQSIEIIPL